MEMSEQRLKDIRLLTLGNSTETAHDDLIKLLFKMGEQRFKFLINTVKRGFDIDVDPLASIPEELEWILDEVIVQRFNRIGSEGYKSQSVEGHSITFDTGDFTNYLKDITSFYDPFLQGWTKGKVIMI